MGIAVGAVTFTIFVVGRSLRRCAPGYVGQDCS